MEQYVDYLEPGRPALLQVAPGEIGESPFGHDINIPATQAEEEALEKSIAESGVLNPIICKRTADGRLQCLAGSRRLRAAKKANLEEVSVQVMSFASEEEERQFAIRDNVERRQLTILNKAKLARLLWRSFKKSSSDKGKAGETSARENAAAAAAISVGTLFNHDFVLKHGSREVIDAMQAETITISAAYGKTKTQIDGAAKETAVRRSVNAIKAMRSMKETTKVLETLSRLSTQIASLAKFADRCKAADKERLKRRLAASKGVLVKLKTDGTLDGLLDTIESVEALLE